MGIMEEEEEEESIAVCCGIEIEGEEFGLRLDTETKGNQNN
jgi:hypothetical protein